MTDPGTPGDGIPVVHFLGLSESDYRVEYVPDDELGNIDREEDGLLVWETLPVDISGADVTGWVLYSIGEADAISGPRDDLDGAVQRAREFLRERPGQ